MSFEIALRFDNVSYFMRNLLVLLAVVVWKTLSVRDKMMTYLIPAGTEICNLIGY